MAAYLTNISKIARSPAGLANINRYGEHENCPTKTKNHDIFSNSTLIPIEKE